MSAHAIALAHRPQPVPLPAADPVAVAALPAPDRGDTRRLDGPVAGGAPGAPAALPLAIQLWLAPALAAGLAAALVAVGLALATDVAPHPAALPLFVLGLLGLGLAAALGVWYQQQICAAPTGLDGAAEAISAGAASTGGGDPGSAAGLVADHDERGLAVLDRDLLTELGGAAWFKGVANARLDAARRSGGRIALLLVDLDRFSDINGFHGFRVGDHVLRQVARRLAVPERQGALLARLAGDRFALLRTDLGEEAAATAFAREIVESVARPICADGIELELSASVGVAIYPDHGGALEPMLRCAEMALGEAKRAGGGRGRIFCKRMDASLKARKAMERELRLAIEQGNFQLHYQPQVDLRTGRIGGVEALLRWPHRSQGMIPPVTFIPLAESSGLIRPLGAWVLAEAGRAARRWRDLGLELEVAVNLSAAQLRQQEIVALVGRVLADNQLPPHALELELTESLFVDPSELTLRRALERVAEMGVQLAIDDFGTGYSSLAYLKRLPVSKIKIDKSFLADIGRERADEALVRAIIGLAKTFGKRVLAEGVETEAQRQFLLREGCDAAQGYLFSRPIPEEAMTRMLLEDARRGTLVPLKVARAG
jgi:diguanylate cyclase (GGDEF)-like protein